MEIANAFALLTNFVILPAITYGAQLSLGALGVTIVFGILRFANFSHGELMSFGAMVTILTTHLLQTKGVSISPMPTALLALPAGILATIVIALLEDQIIFRFYRKNRSTPITFTIVSVGLMFFMAGLIRIIIGPNEHNFADGARFLISFRDFKAITGLDQGIAIRQTQLITLLVTLIVVISLFWFIYKTRWGKAMRAYSDNEDLALLSGINPERVVLIAWIIAGTLACIAGTLYSLDKIYKPFIFMQIMLPVFAATIIGGIGQPLGAVFGGFVVAFSEVTVTYSFKKFLAYLGPTNWEPEGLVQLLSTDYKYAVSFLVLILVLLVRPTGLIPGKTI
ncbi:branched-chain amino acid transport system / permease component family protein [Candidatus Endolissoclinum faulkneri L2]|uniref:Branched-chain amino acid transport system / permease component family protein n=1 Tax=Candidatus Endolissoclinum faulkneri L2 TaxID=1193729 RepID=K7YNB4_9PROT|nr:branched-chain amino acid ABC transporter permease [Candidatus Endolissoclinum faulkneri]AFX98982.1 branched-chain amino acid transport system / permease component family protein [Candidatus Endolissoclinum faulkneri L2]